MFTFLGALPIPMVPKFAGVEEGSEPPKRELA